LARGARVVRRPIWLQKIIRLATRDVGEVANGNAGVAEQTKTETPDAVPIERTRAVEQGISPLLTIKQAAAMLRVSQQWLKYWLVANPTDTSGVLLYIPTGRRWKFEPKDIDRIIAHLRELETARLGPSVKSKVRLVGLMSQVGGASYEQLLNLREANRLKLEANKMEEQRRRRPLEKLPRAKLKRRLKPPADSNS